jgi:hypothetical protein
LLVWEATPGKLTICIWDEMGIVGSNGEGRFKRAMEEMVDGESEMSVARV